MFTPDRFVDLGSRQAVDLALMRHRDSGLIRQLARGLYDYSKIDPELGPLQPSTQVPIRVVYLTDGRPWTVQVGKRQMVLKRTTLRNMATAGRSSGLVIQPLRHLGRENVDEQIIAQLDRRFDENARKQLLNDIRYAPAWIAEIIRRLAGQEQAA